MDRRDVMPLVAVLGCLVLGVFYWWAAIPALLLVGVLTAVERDTRLPDGKAQSGPFTTKPLTFSFMLGGLPALIGTRIVQAIRREGTPPKD